MVRSGTLYAVGGAQLRARRASDGSSAWTLGSEVGRLPNSAPVFQDGPAWPALDPEGTEGVVAADAQKGSEAWPYNQGVSGTWRIAEAGNRVFLLHEAAVTAVPVF